MSFLDLEKAKDICGMYWCSIEFWVCCYRPSGSCIAKWELCLRPWHKVRHVFRLLLVAPLHSICVAQRQDLETLPGKDGVQFGNCKITFLQIMWFCCLHSEHDLQPQNSLQLRVKQPGRESAPPSLRPWLLENRGLPLSWGIECSW